MSILIVDDNAITARIVEINLQMEKYETVVTYSSREALEYLKTSPDIQLVVLDIMMPEIDGLEFLKIMKKTPEWENIPVIMCTSLADSETVLKSIRLGCKHYHVKPIQPEKLIKEITDILEKEKPTLLSEDVIMAKLGLDCKAYVEIIREFYRRLNMTISLLQDQIAERDLTFTSNELRNIKETSFYLGAQRVVNLIDRIIIEIESETEDNDKKLSLHCALLRELRLLQKSLPFRP